MHLSRVRGLVRGNRGALVFLIATSAVNVTNFGFHVIVSRALGTEAYGGLSALLVLMVVLTVPLGALQLASTHAQAGAPHDVSAQRLLSGTLLAGMGALGVVGLLSPLIRSFFHLDSVVPIMLLGVWVPLAVVAAVPSGMLLAQQRFMALALGTFIGGGLVRLLAAVVLTPRMKTNGGMLATVLSQAVTTAFFLCAVRGQIRHREPSLRLSPAQGALSLAAMAGVALATGVDTMLAQHVMPGQDASIYSAAAVAGRMALFAPAAVALIVFPRFVAAQKEGRDDPRLLWGSLGAVLALGLSAAAVLAVVPDLVVRLLFGTEFASSGAEVPLLALEGVALAVLSLMTYYHLARGGWTSLTAAVGSVGVGVAIWWTKPGVHGLALLMAAAMTALALFTVARAGLLSFGRTRSGHMDPVDEALVTEAASL
jgi:O-antigen/teichoic acid export membrane protein